MIQVVIWEELLMNFLDKYIGNAPGDPQHVLIANAFVDAMANSLEQWHNDPSVASIEFTRMAWSGGMRKSEAFNEIDPNEQIAIIFRDSVESGTDVTGQTPISINLCP